MTERHRNGGTLAMIINAGFRHVEVTDLMEQGKIALLEDGHYIWEDSKPIEDPPAGE